MSDKRSTKNSRVRVNGSQLAKRLKIDKATVSRQTDAGVLIRGADGRYDLLENADRWKTYEATKQQGQQITTVAAVVRTRLTNARLASINIDNDIKLRNLVLTSEVTHDAARAAVTLRSVRNAADSELAIVLAGSNLQAWEIEALLKKKSVEVARVLSQSAFAVLHCPHCKKTIHAAQPVGQMELNP